MEDIIKDIAKPHALHHPPDGCVQDRSAPHPPRGYHLEKLDRSPLLHDIQAGAFGRAAAAPRRAGACACARCSATARGESSTSS
mmetsp:Transcript_16776/g.50262  ORF Transcript_16776/g.50262 Transcript_16776/m.50262 type:complete len:84 (-) Transcript_16776:1005-1256(-)|eukprot:354411-Chlamydomonas_euryale.AAC.17